MQVKVYTLEIPRKSTPEKKRVGHLCQQWVSAEAAGSRIRTANLLVGDFVHLGASSHDPGLISLDSRRQF